LVKYVVAVATGGVGGMGEGKPQPQAARAAMNARLAVDYGSADMI